MSQGNQRVIIENVQPEINAGRFPAKRVVGEKVKVTADIFTDGHDLISALILYKGKNKKKWNEAEMVSIINDHWEGSFPIDEFTNYEFTLLAWVDPFKTYRRDLKKKVDAGAVDAIDILIGSELLKQTISETKTRGAKNKILETYANTLGDEGLTLDERIDAALSQDLFVLMRDFSPRKFAMQYERNLPIHVDRLKARFSTWYEMFPRSASFDESRHGTFKDMEEVLPYIAGMGFDVIYLPPIHPVGTTKRKGKNNALQAGENDPGSPWAIGSPEGGHKAVNPQLGAIEDFEKFVKVSEKHGLEVALDIAFQCSPDHPYVKDHPEWFRSRPDGTIQYAENPPKKYEDIYPFDFETDDWKAMWEELRDVFLFWIEKGVKIFRVDNPHTKAFRFWQWAIANIQKKHPDVLFLAEAFTRPKVMNQLAKMGFSQSYTYFTWRNTKYELETYMTELTKTQMSWFFRPNFWPNTPDILHEYLQSGGRNAFVTRFILAATLTANYGIYGPAFELCENRPRNFGSEEYLDSEKYQIREWNLSDNKSLKNLITTVNKIRKHNEALQTNETLTFHPTDNDNIMCYSKADANGENIILMLVNLDPNNGQTSWVNVPLNYLKVEEGHSYHVFDMLSDAWYTWEGDWNYVELGPHTSPAHIFKIRKSPRTEKDFETYL